MGQEKNKLTDHKTENPQNMNQQQLFHHREQLGLDRSHILHGKVSTGRVRGIVSSAHKYYAERQACISRQQIEGHP